MFKVLTHTPYAVERMDDCCLSREELILVERALDTINFLSGSFFRTARWMLREYRRSQVLHSGSFSFLDIGCGGGGLLRYLYHFAVKNSLNISFFGIDTNKTLLSIAQSKNTLSPSIEYSSSRLEATDESYTCIHSNLVLHHIPPEELSFFLALTKERARVAVCHEDLLRSRLGMYLANVFPQLITRSSIVHHDARISVQRSYSKEEWRVKAAAQGYFFRTIFPERIQLMRVL